jgi:hypothetical protein
VQFLDTGACLQFRDVGGVSTGTYTLPGMSSNSAACTSAVARKRDALFSLLIGRDPHLFDCPHDSNCYGLAEIKQSLLS